MDKIIKVFFVIFPALFFSIFLLMLAKGIGSFEYPIMKDIFLILAFMILLAIVLSRYIIRRNKQLNIKILTITFFAIIFAFNIICALKLSGFIQPVSDFEIAYNKANSFYTDSQYDLYYPWWTNFSIFLGIIFKIFNSSGVTVAIMNSIFSTLSSIIIFFIAKKHLKLGQIFSFFPSLLFSFYPSRIFFLPFVAPDFIAEFGFVFISYLFFDYLDIFSSKNTSKKTLIYPVLISLLVFFFSLFKPMQEIFLVLFLIILFIKSFPNLRSYFKKIAYFGLVFICVTFGANFIHAKLFKSYTGINLNKNLILMNKLYVGLNSEGKGYWNPINERYIDYLEKTYGSNTQQISQAMKDKLINNIKQNHQLPNMIINKLDTAFVSDFYGIEWVNISLKSGRMDLNKLRRPIYISNLYYYLILLFALISVINIIKTRDLKKIYFIVFILGFTSVVLIGESQTRYKLAFLFNFIFLASIGIKLIFDSNILQKTKDFLKNV